MSNAHFLVQWQPSVRSTEIIHQVGSFAINLVFMLFEKLSVSYLVKFGCKIYKINQGTKHLGSDEIRPLLIYFSLHMLRKPWHTPTLSHQILFLSMR